VYLYHEENVNESSLLNRYIGSSNLCCLSQDTKIQTDSSEKFIKDIEVGDFVKSFNIETKEIEFKEVTMSMLTKPKAKVMEITDENGNTLICTPDHRIFTENRGYVFASELREDDVLNIVE
jgi:intein/homing endonuclease